MQTLIFMKDKLILIVVPLLLFIQTRADGIPQKSEFWYSAPASEWTSAIPLGNGRIGGMFYGGIEKEIILLNENSIWCGKPFAENNPRGPELVAQMRQLLFDGRYIEAESLCNNEFLDGKAANLKADCRSYQPFAFLNLDFTDKGAEVSDYERWLDYEKALGWVSFKQDGVRYTREFFVSAPDQVMAVRLTADAPGKISFTASASRPFGAKVKAVRNNLVVKGQAYDEEGDFKGVRFDGIIRFDATGGKVSAKGSEVSVQDAECVTIYIAINTDYNLQNPEKPLKRDRTKACRQQIESARKKGFEALERAHTDDYESFYRRYSLEVNFADSSKVSGTPSGPEQALRPGRAETPVDRRIQAAVTAKDTELLLLYHNYCRYLLISASREGGLPMNLQGIWNPYMKAPWRSNFHLNINIEEAYWFAEQAGLPECHEPLFTMTEKLAADGQNTARTVLGVNRGFAAGHRSDVWFPARIIGHQGKHGMYVSGAAWCTLHLMEHYRFTQDRVFLKERAFPLLRGSALFFADWLVRDPRSGKLVSGPSGSPENRFLIDGMPASLTMGCTHDQEIIWSTFKDYLEACEILGYDDAETQEVRQALRELALPRIGSDGRLLEWPEEFEEEEPGHRHLSHLFGMMPGHRITPDGTPELAEAVRKSLEYRLSHNYSAQGWSLGWASCLLCRLKEGDRALRLIEQEYFKKTYPAMFVNAHGKAQVGDMMGVPLAMMEFLLQSHGGCLELLPALPSDWTGGRVRGLCARGGFVTDITWEDGALKSASILSRSGGVCTLRYRGRTLKFSTVLGQTITVAAKDFVH